MVRYVKSRHLVFDTPIELTRHQTVAEALSLIPKRSHRAAVVVEDGRPVGVVSEADCSDVDRFAQVQHVMRAPAVTITADTDPRAAFDALDAQHAELAVAVGDDGRLLGVLTRTGALRATLYAPAVDERGGLRIAAAVGVNGDVAARAGELLEAGWTAWWWTPPTATRTGCWTPCGRSGPWRPACPWRPATWWPPTGPGRWSRPVPTSSRSGSVRAPCAPRG